MTQATLQDLSGLSLSIFTSFWDRLADVVDLFNANSNGTIRLTVADVVGQLNKRAFYARNSTNSRRDPSDTADRVRAGHSKDVITTPVVNRTMADDIQESDIIQDGGSITDYAVNLGINMANDRMEASISTAIAVLTGCIQSEATLVSDVSGGSNNVTIDRMNTAKGLLGDRRSSIRGYIMHSVPYGNLVGSVIGQSVESVTEIAPGLMRDDSSLAVLGAPIFVTDNIALKDGDDYLTLLLPDSAIMINEQDTVGIETTRTHIKKSTILETVGEYNQELMPKGFDYTSTSNPTDATLAATANWTLKVSSIKSAAGVVLKTDG